MLIFKDNEVELFLGDIVILKPPGNKDSRFFHSRIGKLFKSGVADECRLTAKQQPWLEIYFDVVLYKDGKPVFEDGTEAESPEAAAVKAGYKFLRYVLTNKVEISESA